ncbi:MAG: winged helix-turn-helix domain-containing protein [Pseudohongiella sp.]|nr:winged helix-turn-helix domain-containing protein [Pseudohongiella sp.]
MTISLSLADARKTILNSQRLHSRSSFGKGVDASLQAIEHLGYVQIDTLSVVSRAHLHTLWNRVKGFTPDHIDQLQQDRRVFEHWAHALAILPMKDYRFSLPMMNRIASGATHWHPKDSKETKKVLKRIREEGPLQAKDFDDKRKSNQMWARSASKMALEQLFMEGELMIPHRINFHKVYDLRERVLSAEVDTRLPSEAELCRHLIQSFLRAQGIAQVNEMAYLRKGLGASMSKVVQQMEEEKLLVAVDVAGQKYYSSIDAVAQLQQPQARAGLRILSPFDNAIIQRKRVGKLFDFNYQLECYVPKEKREYGYFCLPILRNNKLLGRIDAKASRKEGVLHILHLHLEKPINNIEIFYSDLLAEIKRFAAFDNCPTVLLHRVSGAQSRPDWN